VPRARAGNDPEQYVLDVDIENRPLTYLGMDFTTSDITAIAWGWGRGQPIECRLLGRDDIVDALEDFSAAYRAADMVTGHYMRVHDLPIINGALMEYGLLGLPAKLTSDTKLDLRHLSGISKSQESLSATLGIKAPKIHMSQHDWRRANRLEHVELAEVRCVSDVRQHQELRLALLRRGLLKPPKMWRP
jgi:hypothetical protein